MSLPFEHRRRPGRTDARHTRTIDRLESVGIERHRPRSSIRGKGRAGRCGDASRGKAPEQRFATAGEFERALLPMASEAGRDAVARLLNRLFDANREREQRAALLAAAAGQASARVARSPRG